MIFNVLPKAEVSWLRTAQLHDRFGEFKSDAWLNTPKGAMLRFLLRVID
jgi:hypothetical protein